MLRMLKPFSSCSEQSHGRTGRCGGAAVHSPVLQRLISRQQPTAVLAAAAAHAGVPTGSSGAPERSSSASEESTRVKGAAVNSSASPNSKRAAAPTSSGQGTGKSSFSLGHRPQKLSVKRRSNSSNNTSYGQGRTSTPGLPSRKARTKAQPEAGDSSVPDGSTHPGSLIPHQQQQPPGKQSAGPAAELCASSSRGPPAESSEFTSKRTASNSNSGTMPGCLGATSNTGQRHQQQQHLSQLQGDLQRPRGQQQQQPTRAAATASALPGGTSNHHNSSSHDNSSSDSTGGGSSSDSTPSSNTVRGTWSTTGVQTSSQQPKLPKLSLRSTETATDTRSSSSTSSRHHGKGSRLAQDDAAGAAGVPVLDSRFKTPRHSSSCSSSSSRHSRSPQQSTQHDSQQQPGRARELRPGRHSSSSSSSGDRASKAASYAVQGLRYKSFRELSDVAQRYGSSTSLTNLMAMFSRLKIVPRSSSKDKIELLQLLWQQLQPQLSKASPRHCAEAMLTASKLQAPLTGLYEQCLSAFISKIDSAEPRILSNAIYAVGTAAGPITSNDVIRTTVEQQLLPAFAAIEQPGYPQAVSNVLYAAAVLGVGTGSLDAQRLLQGLDRGFWGSGTTQELSNTLWGVAELGQTLRSEQLQEIVEIIVQKLPETKPVHITNTLWAVVTMGQQLHAGQVQQMASAMLQKPLYARVIGSMLWSIGKLGHQLPQQQIYTFMQLLVADLVPTPSGATGPASSITRMTSSLPTSDSALFSTPHAIANALHGVATMKRTVSSQHIDQLLAVLVSLPISQSADCNPQALTNTLWAIATMKGQISTYHLDQIYSALASKLKNAEPQAVANAIWAAGSFVPCYLPRQLLTNEAVQYIVQEQIPSMKPQELSNIAFACGMLGHLEPVLMDAIIKQTMQILTYAPAAAATSSSVGTASQPAEPGEANSTSAAFAIQGLCLICWAGALLDMRGHVAELQQIAAQCSRVWSSSDFVEADKVQLFQLHMWLVEQCGLQDGLLGQLSQQQIDECREAWVELVRTLSKASHTQRTVYEAARRLPELQNVQLEVTTPDQLWSMDISAKVADGRKLVIEVDGPFHYRRPDRGPTGSTVFRDRALAYRGYIAITVPWWEWSELLHHDMSEKVAYLRAKVQHSLQMP